MIPPSAKQLMPPEFASAEAMETTDHSKALRMIECLEQLNELAGVEDTIVELLNEPSRADCLFRVHQAINAIRHLAAELGEVSGAHQKH